jgi:LacI family transcriptional regulator
VQFLSNTGESIDRQREVVASMREHGISGLIVSPARGTEAADFKSLTNAGIPVVIVVRNIPGAKVSSLVSDNLAGASAAVEHLASLGHRRIAFMGGFANTAVFAERLGGYRDALAKAGIAFDDDFGVCDGLRARRLEPGVDFAVVGFDDVIEAESAVPALTTISVDPQGMGRRAAQLLLKQINSGKVEAEAIVSAVRLVVRQSSGAGLDTTARRAVS